MGNQSTSGIVEEKAANEATEEIQEVNSPDCLIEEEKENHILIQEDETKDFQENAAYDAEADKSPGPVERRTFGENEVSEKHEGSANEDSEIQNDASVDVSSNHVESKGLNSEEGKSKLNDEVHGDKPCNVNGEMQINDSNLEPTFMTKESVDITSEPQEDQNMTAKEIVETLEFANTTSHIDDCDVEKNGDDLVDKGNSLETCTPKEENCIENDRKEGDSPQEEQKIDPFDALNNLSSISLQDSARNEEKNEFLATLDEEKPKMMNELGNGDQDQLEMIQSDIKKIGEEDGVKINLCLSVEEIDLVEDVKEEDERNQSNSIKSTPIEELKDSSDETNEIVTKIELVQTENDNKKDQESEKTSTMKESPLQPQSSSEISTATEMSEQNSLIETLTAENSESMLNTKSNPGYKGVRVELRKTSSFDFGVPFDAIMSEFDKTPLLLCQDRTTAIRSFSSNSALKFQHRSVQTEYVQYDEVDEKTIRMERSNSDITNFTMNKKEKANNSSVSYKKQLEENGLKMASPSRDQEKGKRKPRSSLFSTCICCTTAIS